MNPCWWGVSILFKIGASLLAATLATILYMTVIIEIGLQCLGRKQLTCLGNGLISPSSKLPSMDLPWKALFAIKIIGSFSSYKNSLKNLTVIPSHLGDFSSPIAKTIIRKNYSVEKKRISLGNASFDRVKNPLLSILHFLWKNFFLTNNLRKIGQHSLSHSIRVNCLIPFVIL